MTKNLANNSVTNEGGITISTNSPSSFVIEEKISRNPINTKTRIKVPTNIKDNFTKKNHPFFFVKIIFAIPDIGKSDQWKNNKPEKLHWIRCSLFARPTMTVTPPSINNWRMAGCVRMITATSWPSCLLRSMHASGSGQGHDAKRRRGCDNSRNNGIRYATLIIVLTLAKDPKT